MGELSWTQPADSDSPLLALPLTGGAAHQLVGCVKRTAFAAGREDVYYVACDPGPNPELRVINPATGRDRLLGRPRGTRTSSYPSVSPCRPTKCQSFTRSASGTALT